MKPALLGTGFELKDLLQLVLRIGFGGHSLRVNDGDFTQLIL